MSYETVRVGSDSLRLKWRSRSGLRAGNPQTNWHLDEVAITIRGVKQWLRRTVDSEGQILDVLTRSRRNARAAKRFISTLIARWGPREGDNK